MPALRQNRKMRLPSPDSGDGSFTLIELLVVLIIASVLMALLYTVLTKSRSQAMDGQAKAEVKALEGAILSYRAANGLYPRQAQGANDMFYLTNNMLIVSLLASNDPRGRVHLRVPTNALNDTVYRDPWGFPYAICMDEDGDGVIMLDDRIRPEIRNMAYSNKTGTAGGQVTIRWGTNNIAFAAPVGVFSLKGVGNVSANAAGIPIRSWE
jgi:prepilin-type N-terminal cleavage/methylation domain-containing protein